jgi:hypothetical protein
MKYLFGFIILIGSSSITFSQQIQIRDAKSIVPSDSKPLVVVDGKVLPKLVKSKADSTKWVDPLNEIDSNEIDKINIIKNETAVAIYGEFGRNGVVEITMKHCKKN